MTMKAQMPSNVECAEQILTAVPAIVRELWNRLQAETPMAVTWAQFGLLSLLYQRRLDLTTLAREWGVSAPSMSKMVNLLVKRGWITGEPDPTDRRRKLLSLTPTGHQVHERVREAVRKNLACSLDRLNGEQQAQIVSSLDLLVRTLT